MKNNKKTKRGKVFIIDLNVWGTKIFVSVNQTDKEFTRFVGFNQQHFAPNYDPVQFEDNGSHEFSAAVTIFNKHKKPIGIRFRDVKKTDPFDVSVIVHEASHTTQYLLNFLGLKRTNKSEEAYAYTEDFIVRKILEKI